MFSEILMIKRSLGKSNANVALSLSHNIGNNSSSHWRDTFSKPGKNLVLENSQSYSNTLVEGNLGWNLGLFVNHQKSTIMDSSRIVDMMHHFQTRRLCTMEHKY